MSIKLKSNIIDFYGNPAGYLNNQLATVDSNFKCDEIMQWLDERNFETIFVDGVFEKLSLNLKQEESYSTLEQETVPLKNVRVWQLRQGFDIDWRFASYEEMLSRHGEPTEDIYRTVFDGEMQTNDLEQIYQICNLNHPQGYEGHSLSMSDVVELYDDSGSEFHYVDRFGFKQIEFTTSVTLEQKEHQSMMQ